MHSVSRLLPRAALVACALAVIALATDFVSAQGPRAGRRLVTEMLDGHEVVAGEVLLRFRDQQRAALDQAQAELDTDADEVEVVSRRGLRRLHSRRHGTRALLAMLRANPDVELAEPNYVIRVGATPNDPLFSGYLWGLLNFGQAIPYPTGSGGVPGADIDATIAWDTQTGSRASVVGVVDTGIDYNHPDLAANVWSAPSTFSVFVGGAWINCAAGTHGFNAITNTCDPMDDHNHGTHVAGTIGAVGNNGVGVAGVNWVASLMGLKFLDASGSGITSDAIKLIEFAIQAKAAFAGSGAANVRVLNNSWGGGGDSLLADAIDDANASDMLFVAAAGNGGSDGVGDNNDATPHYPSSYPSPNVIAVAATTNQDLRASFSNWGATSVDLGAPGQSIASTIRNNNYAYFNGTSMATPHVAGAAALVLAECPWLTTSDLKTLLLSTVDPIMSMASITTTGGRLNVNNAVRACGVQSVTVTPNLASPRDSGTTITWTATSNGGTAPYQYKWWQFDGAAWTMSQDWSASNTLAWTPAIGGQYQIRVWVRSSGNPGDVAEASATANYTITVPPVSSVTLTADRTAPQPLGTTITWTASSGGGVAPHQYKWWVFDGVSWTMVTGWTSSNTFAWTPNIVNANYYVAVWVKSAGNPADAPDTLNQAQFAISVPPPVTGVTLTANRSAPQAPGTTITWTAAPSGGVTPYQYKFWVYDGTAWSFATAWSSANTFAWTPTLPHANYMVAVWVKSAGNPADAPDTLNQVPFAIIVPPPVTGVTLTADRSAPQAPGTTITWTAVPSGGVTPYQYKFWVYDGTAWSFATAWSSANTFAWTPTLPHANYMVAVWVKSAGKPADAPDTLNQVPFAIIVPPPVTDVTLTANLSAPQAPGTTITWTAVPSGGVTPYQYKFWVFDGMAWSFATAWSSTNTFAWTPTLPHANYMVAVWVKSAGNPADAADTLNQLQFPIIGPAVTATAVTLTANLSAPQAPGTTITWTAGPSGGVTPYQYKFWVYDGMAWSFATAWSSVNTFAWTPTLTHANYYVAVWVKSAGNPADAPETLNQLQFPIQ